MWSQCGARVRIPLEDCQPVKSSGVLRLALSRCASSRFAQDDKLRKGRPIARDDSLRMTVKMKAGVQDPTHRKERHVWGTLYNRVGVVKRHVSRGRGLNFDFPFVEGFDLVLPLLVLTDQGSLSESRGGRLVPPAIYPVTSLPTMIRCSDSPTVRGGKAGLRPGAPGSRRPLFGR
jgi:hypothetical protein